MCQPGYNLFLGGFQVGNLLCYMVTQHVLVFYEQWLVAFFVLILVQQG